MLPSHNNPEGSMPEPRESSAERWSVRVPRLWGWCTVRRFPTERAARDWLAQFGPIDGRVFDR